MQARPRPAADPRDNRSQHLSVAPRHSKTTFALARQLTSGQSCQCRDAGFPSSLSLAFYPDCRATALRRPQSRRTRCRSLGVSPTAFIAHPPDLQLWLLMDMDFATSCPLVRPALPRIRFLFVGSRLCSTLPSDGPSRFRPCALLVLHLHQVAQGTFTPKLSDMSDTQDAARRLRRCRRMRGGILDCRCARCSAGRQVGTKGWF